MSNHLTDKEIDYLVSGLASERDASKARAHLSSCSQCRKVVDALSSAVAEHPVDSIPGEHVRAAVMAHWHRLHNENVRREAQGRPAMKRYIAGLAAAASVVIAVSLYIFSGIMKTDEGFPLAIKSVAGEVYLNDSATAAGIPFRKGSVIRTGSTGNASISSEGYTLYLGGSSYLDLSENSRSSGISFRLGGGAVISKSYGEISYSFECGRYRVAPAGTEFMVRFSGDNLDVAVLKGRVSVTGADLHVEIPSGQMWSSETPDRFKALDPATEAMIYTGSFSILPYGKKPAEGEMNKPDHDGSRTGSGSQSEETNSIEKNKEKPERIRLQRELREEISGMKREQRMERRARNRE